MKPEIDYSLYLVTDRTLMRADTLEQAVEQSIQGGTTLVQLREKDVSSLEFYETAKSIKKITDRFHTPLIINDRVDLALAVDAAGIHVGQSDLPAKVVRSIIGKNKILGVSVSTLEEALLAYEDGADYLGVGAMFSTGTKTDAKQVTLDTLRQIRAAVQIPIVIIGGINQQTLPLFAHSGVDGAAVVSALIAAPDIAAAAKELKILAQQMKFFPTP